MKEREPHAKSQYTDRDMQIALSFAKNIYKEMRQMIKAVVIFGSTARKETTEHSDVDVLVVIDDVRIVLTPELMEAYSIIINKQINAVSKRLHVITLRLTSFWEYVHVGDPVAINILRDGFALIDTGFIEPLQHLLYLGKMRPTQESITNYWQKAPMSLRSAEFKLLEACVDLYWSCVDAAHAALMSRGHIPPSPAHIPELMEKEFVAKADIDKRYAEEMAFFYQLMKQITHREKTIVYGKEFDQYRDRAVKFIKEMERFVKKY